MITSRDELRELRARALCLDEDPGQIGTQGSCERGCIHPAVGSVCPYLSGAEATMKAEEEAGLAVVPYALTPEILDAFSAHGNRADGLRAAISTGNLLIEKE